MKRFVAAAIDAELLKIADVFVYCIVISIMRICRNFTMEYMGSYSGIMLVVVYFLVSILVDFAYFFFCEWKGNGRSIGKIIVRMKMEMHETVPVWKKAVIAGLKVLACFLYPITAGYYFFFDKMPYDNMRGYNQ